MVKWEYKALYLLGDELESLNELGSRGWELVAINPGTEEWEAAKAYLKRPVTAGPFIKREVIIGKRPETEDIYTFNPSTGKEVFMGKIVNKKKELLFQFRAMVLELIEVGNMIPSEVKKKAYDLIDSCYDEDGELIA